MFKTLLFSTSYLRLFYATCTTSSKLCWKPPCTARELIIKHGFLPCKNSAPDPWSNRRHSPRQHVNYHGILTGHSCEINQIILCSSRVFVCWGAWRIDWEEFNSVESRRDCQQNWQGDKIRSIQYSAPFSRGTRSLWDHLRPSASRCSAILLQVCL